MGLKNLAWSHVIGDPYFKNGAVVVPVSFICNDASTDPPVLVDAFDRQYSGNDLTPARVSDLIANEYNRVELGAETMAVFDKSAVAFARDADGLATTPGLAEMNAARAAQDAAAAAQGDVLAQKLVDAVVASLAAASASAAKPQG